MAGNSQRKGAIRKDKKGPTVGSGGQRRKQLKGRGPTPKASERDKHVAAKRARSAAKRSDSKTPVKAAGRGKPRPKGGPEYVVGRNAVVESLTAKIPATALYVAERIDNALKVTEDVFYARIYGTALSIFRTKAWEDSINRKISIINQSYTMLSNRTINQRSELLEITIVALILLEVILGVLGVMN
jgi:hypothetical protein